MHGHACTHAPRYAPTAPRPQPAPAPRLCLCLLQMLAGFDFTEPDPPHARGYHDGVDALSRSTSRCAPRHMR